MNTQRHTLREFEDFSNGHRLYRGIANARPLHPLPEAITDPGQITRLDNGQEFRQGQVQ
ncbi:hypothetical protein ACWC0C_34620 [Streptomyces sp. NPDC001709]